MKKNRWIILVALLALLILPVLAAQFRVPQTRNLTGVELQDVSFQEVTFVNDVHDLKLGGMLFVPEGEGPFPAAVIIHGSGTSYRDNIWYLTLARYLQESGVIVLLPDKRGSESSEGNWETASFEDLAVDTIAGLDFLSAREDLEISYLGLIGLSQGGVIAPLAAEQSQEVAFVVNVVGGALPMHASLVYEENHNLREIGLLPGYSNLLAYPAAWSLIYARQVDFWNAVGNFNPLPYWKDLNVKSLILYGEEDTNVPTRRSAANLRSLDNPSIEVIIYPGSGHALESPEGEGNSIFRPDALEEIASFILAGKDAGNDD
jgi:dienelactone hydrolase